MTKLKIDTRSGIMLCVIIFAFIGIPYAIWSDHMDSVHLKNRAKPTIGRVIGLKGLKRNTVVVEYYVNNHRLEQVRSAPSRINVSIGDSLIIKYDSLDYENIQINWSEPK